MRGQEFLDKLSLTDLSLVEKADIPQKRKKQLFIPCAAACLAILCFVGTLIFHPKNTVQISFGGITREYQKHSVDVPSVALIWPWEYRTLPEQYNTLTLNGKTYTSRGRTVSSAYLGENLGIHTISGFDELTETEHRIEAEVSAIEGVSRENFVAVKLAEETYVFSQNKYDPPKTFGEFLAQANLNQTLPLKQFTVKNGPKENGPYLLQDDSFIWEILSGCHNAGFVEENDGIYSEVKAITFSATSEALGIYKRAFLITSDGFIKTNIFDYAYVFNIGEEAAAEIIAYAEKNGDKTEYEPYSYSLTGTVTEISEEYLFLDDSILCPPKTEGMIFKIPLDDLQISRYVDYNQISVGDTVSVSFTGQINTENENIVSGAYAIATAYISGKDISIPE